MSINKKVFLLENIPKKKCRYCSQRYNLTYDHKIPVVKGGKDDLKNIQVLCSWCNGIKSGLSHKQVMRIARWLYFVNKKRLSLGKKPLGVRNKDMVELSTDTTVQLI